MKSKLSFVVLSCLHLLLFAAPFSKAQEKPTCKISVAMLNLPEGSEGVLHWRSDTLLTTPLQLSTRYFSEPMKVSGPVIQFFKNPIIDSRPDALPPVPLVSISLPAQTPQAYIVLMSQSDANGQIVYKGMLVRAQDWKVDSLKVINGCSSKIAILAGDKRFLLAAGRSTDLDSGDWKDTFDVKIYLESPAPKLVFSSKWRISAGNREICFLSEKNGKISIRSLIDLAARRTGEAARQAKGAG